MSMTQREMIKLLKKHGGNEIPGGGKGSHAKVKMPNNQMVIVPRRTCKRYGATNTQTGRVKIILALLGITKRKRCFIC